MRATLSLDDNANRTATLLLARETHFAASRAASDSVALRSAEGMWGSGSSIGLDALVRASGPTKISVECRARSFSECEARPPSADPPSYKALSHACIGSPTSWRGFARSQCVGTPIPRIRRMRLPSASEVSPAHRGQPSVAALMAPHPVPLPGGARSVAKARSERRGGPPLHVKPLRRFRGHVNHARRV